MSIGERIRMIRGELQQREIAKKLDVHRNTYGRYETGESIPDVETASRILALFPDVNPLWFFTGQGEPMITALQKSQLGVDREDYLALPRYEERQGPKGEARGATPYFFRRQWLQAVVSDDLDSLFTYVVKFDSMAPTLKHGAVAIIDKSQDLSDEGIFLFKYGGFHHIRRFKLDPEKQKPISMKCDNQAAAPTYDRDMSFDDFSEQCEIIGRVVWVGNPL
jgi:phage repressor protein C with HTH and peptisase S24 domain